MGRLDDMAAIAAVAEARAAAVRECIELVCPLCRSGAAPVKDANPERAGRWFHPGESGIEWEEPFPCRARQIHEARYQERKAQGEG